MPHDPARVEDTQAWLRRAALDLRAAKHVLNAHPALLGDSAFHCQQAAEKASKAFLAWHDDPFRKTHNLEEIGSQAAAIDPSLQRLVGRAAVLTEYAWKFRYPGAPEEPPRAEVEDALALAQEVYDAIIARLPHEVRP